MAYTFELLKHNHRVPSGFTHIRTEDSWHLNGKPTHVYINDKKYDSAVAMRKDIYNILVKNNLSRPHKPSPLDCDNVVVVYNGRQDKGTIQYFRLTDGKMGVIWKSFGSDEFYLVKSNGELER